MRVARVRYDRQVCYYHLMDRSAGLRWLKSPMRRCDPRFSRPALPAVFPGDRAAIGKHEQAHTLQSMVWGPFSFPAYFLNGGISADNPMEKAADAYAFTGRGWWPR